MAKAVFAPSAFLAPPKLLNPIHNRPAVLVDFH